MPYMVAPSTSMHYHGAYGMPSGMPVTGSASTGVRVMVEDGCVFHFEVGNAMCVAGEVACVCLTVSACIGHSVWVSVSSQAGGGPSL